MTHPRIEELPETFRHPRHFWIFDQPTELQVQIWLARFRQSERIWAARDQQP